jgi:hypothetical protein
MQIRFLGTSNEEQACHVQVAGAVAAVLLASCATPPPQASVQPVAQPAASAPAPPSGMVEPGEFASPADEGAPSCGGERCGGDAPVCCWNAEAHTGVCVRDVCPAAWTPETTTILDCSMPRRDCGDEGFCSDFRTQVPTRFVCWDAEFAEQKSSTFLCVTPADCPAWLGASRGCEPHSSLPPGVRMCEW